MNSPNAQRRPSRSLSTSPRAQRRNSHSHSVSPKTGRKVDINQMANAVEVSQIIEALQAPGPHKKLVRGDRSFVEMLVEDNSMCVITDMEQPDHPIVFATKSFQDFTGYQPADILGKNCRFLSRPPVCPEAAERLTEEEKALNAESLERIRSALVLQSREPICVSLVNFKKDGTRFNNSFFMTAIMNEYGDLVYFVGVQQIEGAQFLDCDQNKAYTMRREQLETSSPKLWRPKRQNLLGCLFKPLHQQTKHAAARPKAQAIAV